MSDLISRKENILQLSDKYLPEMLVLRRHLHMYPELSKQEFETTKSINQVLDHYGISRIPVSSQTGSAAEVKGKSNRTIAIRADIDALPIEEESDLEFRSKIPGISHMCGHDVHTVISLGATLILQELQEDLPGNVRILFQPAEEFEGGAESMIDDGLLNGVSAIIGLHNTPDQEVGTIGIKEGFLMAGIDDFIITIKGKGGHAGIPERTIDPIIIGSAVVTQLQTLVSRTISPKESAVVTIGTFQAGRTNNVIPERAVLTGTVRTSSDTVRYKIRDEFVRLVTNQVHALGGEVEIDYQLLIPPVVNDPAIAAISRIAAVDIVGTKNVLAAEPTMGGDDFALYQKVVPGCYAWLGSGNKEKGIEHGWHHPKFMVDEDAIKIGIQWMVHTVIRLLEDKSLT